MTTTSTELRGLVAIDPGLNSMGWAYWEESDVIEMRRRSCVHPPTEVGLIKAPRKLDLAPRALWIATTLRKELVRVNAEILDEGHAAEYAYLDFVSEYPAWMNIQLGWAAGDLQKLVFLVGVLAGYFHTAHSFQPVPPGEWKGQLPKSVVTRRIQRLIGHGATREWEKDIWDAVGIGYWRLGKLFQ